MLQATDASAHEEQGTSGFPVVGVGASAGGLGACERFFHTLPAKPDMAFVLVQHLDPTHESSLAELLQNHTAMPVVQVEEGAVVQPGRVYVIPPAKELIIEEGTLRLSVPTAARGRRAPIDAFFRSLADDQRERAVCIILSGTGSDGSIGLKRVKENGGLVFVQEPEDAEYDGMPRSAMATGLVDLVAPAAELARKLIAYHRSAARIQLPDGTEKLPEAESDLLLKILRQIRHQTGNDFSQYKHATILRRLKRRMQMGQIESMPAYLDVLRRSDTEAQALVKDFLISVTNFFRDEDEFRTLSEQVVPDLFSDKSSNDQIRVWVPGCATGEEAFSLAMLLCEYKDTLRASPRIQVFGTDIDVEALNFARQALYPEVIAADLSAERLERFFDKEHNGYRVKKSIRDMVLLAQHNLLRDPPFSKIDLISCRNLLIYLKRNVQQNVFRLFHYALREDGFLFLGGSETAEKRSDLFEEVTKQASLYRRKPGAARLALPSSLEEGTRLDQEADAPHTARRAASLGEVHRDLMLHAYAPPSVIVDEKYEIRYLFGEVGRYVRPTEGEPSHNLLHMVPRDMRVELRTGLFQVFKKREAANARQVAIKQDEQEHLVNLVVRPINREDVRDNLALVIFEPVPEPADVPGRLLGDGKGYDETIVEQLEDELERTKHRLETVIEEYETSNEELKASNEELQSMNEELRSTAEELETSKEELQSTNEELETVNEELKVKVGQLDHANSDLENLIASTHVGTLFLNSRLCLKRYTPSATNLFNLIPADLGRPFSHISHKIEHDDLPGMAEHVLRNLITVEEEVQGRERGWYLIRMMPYRTLEDKIDGVVLTFVDVTELKEAQQDERERAIHHEIVAELRQTALKGTDQQALMNQAVFKIAETLDVEYCELLELRAEEGDLLLRAGVGWKDGFVGQATVGTEQNSQAGYTLKLGEPVIVEDLYTEERFAGPPLLKEHNVKSGLTVVLQGAAQPYGVLGVHTRKKRTFTEQEIHFVQSVAHMLGAAIERHRAEEALRKSEVRYHAIFDTVGVSIWHEDFSQVKKGLEALKAEGVTDLRTYLEEHPAFVEQMLERVQVRDVNEATLKMYGASSKKEMLGKLSPVFLPEALPVFREELLLLAEGRSFMTSEVPMRTLNGERMDVAITFTAADAPEYHHVIVSLLDITERKRMEDALRESEARFRAMTDAAPMLVWMSGTDRLCTYFNVQWLEFTGRALDQEVGEGWAEGVHSEDSDRCLNVYTTAFDTREPFEVEYRLRRYDGEHRWILSRGLPRFAPDGAFLGFIGSCIDIHDRKQAEKALQRKRQELIVLNEELEERVQARTQQVRALASSLTLAEQGERHRIAQILHDDLQQLLYGAQIQLHIAEQTMGKTDAQVSTQLTAVSEVIDRAINVARNLTVDLSPPVLKGEGLAEALRWLASHMQEIHGLKVHIEASEHGPVKNEEMRVLLFHLVRELLFNVVKHANVDDAKVVLSRADHKIRILVEDAGIGFDAEMVSRPGTGLGLTSVQERLGLFGGNLEVITAPGKGTKAIITVPTASTEY